MLSFNRNFKTCFYFRPDEMLDIFFNSTQNKPGDKGGEQSNRGEKRKAEEIDEDEENDKKDEVK